MNSAFSLFYGYFGVAGNTLLLMEKFHKIENFTGGLNYGKNCRNHYQYVFHIRSDASLGEDLRRDNCNLRWDTYWSTCDVRYAVSDLQERTKKKTEEDEQRVEVLKGRESLRNQWLFSFRVEFMDICGEILIN